MKFLSLYNSDINYSQRRVQSPLRCSCKKFFKKKCEIHDNMFNRCVISVVNHVKMFIQSWMFYRVYTDFMHYSYGRHIIDFRGLGKSIESFTSVEVSELRRPLDIVKFESVVDNIVEKLRIAGFNAIHNSFDVGNHLFLILSVGQGVFNVLLEGVSSKLSDILVVKYDFPKYSKLLFILTITISRLGIVQAFPDYLVGEELIQSNVVMTYYWVDFPGDFKRSGRTLEFGSCSGEQFGKADVSFLRNMALDGTGMLDDVLYNLSDCDCNGRYFCFMKVNQTESPYGLSDSGKSLKPFITIAANDISKGIYFIPQIVGWPVPGSNLKHNGCVEVEDSSWSFDEKQLDFYVYRMKYYAIWDDVYDSPRVDIYSASECPLLDYIGNKKDTGESNFGNDTDSDKGNDNVCVCPGNDTAEETQSKVSIKPSSTKSVRPTATTHYPTVAPDTHKREVYEKRGSVAKVPSCAGYNCFPVHVLLIVTIVIVVLIPFIAFLLKNRFYRVHIYAMGLIILYVIGVCAYCIVALKSEGPVKIAIVDEGYSEVNKKISEISKRFEFRPSYACTNHSFHYIITCSLGGGLVLIGILILIREYNKARHKIWHNYTFEGIAFVTFGTTLSILSGIVLYAYSKCFNGDKLKFLCNIGGNLFWGSVAATVVAFALLVLQTFVQFCSLMMWMSKLDIMKPVMGIVFAIIIVTGMAFMDANACF